MLFTPSELERLICGELPLLFLLFFPIMLFCFTLMSSVADPDPEPDPDPHILGLPDPDPLVHAVHPLGAGDAHLRGEGQASFIFSPLLSIVGDPDPQDPHVIGPDPDLLVRGPDPDPALFS
jgi:hypothetical protein